MSRSQTTEDRIQKQLDRLENPNLTKEEIAVIEQKIALLKDQRN